MLIKKKIFLYFFIFYCSFFYSQKKNTTLKEIYSLSFCKNDIETSFCKSIEFYKENLYDSAYVYSNKSLLKEKEVFKRNILFYIQGGSAIRKKIYKKALQSLLSINDYSFFLLKEQKLGRVFLGLELYDEAINHYMLWEKSNGFTGKYLKKVGFHNIGLCYIHKKNFNQAKKYFEKELDLIEAKDTLSVIRAKMDLANVYYEQYLDDEAIPLFKEAYDLARVFSDIELKQQASKNMAVIEKNRKNFKASVQYYTEHDKLKDSLYNRDKIWELTEKDKQLAVAQKQSEIVIQDEKLKRQKVQRDGLITGLVGLLVFIGGLGFFYKKLQSQNRFITKQKEALNIANNTKDYLFSVVSHDLRSPINTIKRQHKELQKHITNNNLEALTVTNNKAIAVTESTSHLLNNILHWSLEQSNQLLFTPEEMPIKQLVEHVLYDYKLLVAANNITIASELENTFVNIDKESVKIVLRNVLDNAVKYGGKEIMVTTGVLNEKAFIKVQDSGVGISKEKLQKINSLTDLSVDKIDRSQGVGLGVILCHTLVRKNKGILTFASEPNQGTTVIIELPNVEA